MTRPWKTLDGDYYRARADLCLKLAASARAAQPLFARLSNLAETYMTKARSADSKAGGGEGRTIGVDFGR
jgi:hypothetical protein